MQDPDPPGSRLGRLAAGDGSPVGIVAGPFVGIGVRGEGIPSDGTGVGNRFVGTGRAVQLGLEGDDQALAQGEAVGGDGEAAGSRRIGDGDRAGNLGASGDAGSLGAQDQLVTARIAAAAVTGQAHDHVPAGQVEPQLVLGQVPVGDIGDVHRAGDRFVEDIHRDRCRTGIDIGDPELDLAHLVSAVTVVALGVEDAVEVDRRAHVVDHHVRSGAVTGILAGALVVGGADLGRGHRAVIEVFDHEGRIAKLARGGRGHWVGEDAGRERAGGGERGDLVAGQRGSEDGELVDGLGEGLAAILEVADAKNVGRAGGGGGANQYAIDVEGGLATGRDGGEVVPVRITGEEVGTAVEEIARPVAEGAEVVVAVAYDNLVIRC